MALQCDTFPHPNPCDTFSCTETLVTLNFLVLDRGTRKPIPGASYEVYQSSNVLGSGFSSVRGKFSVATTIRVTPTPVFYPYSYNVRKEGYIPKTDVEVQLTGGGETVILMDPVEIPGEYPAVLMLVLDQTGSIGAGGAQRGVDIIDRTDVQAMGYVSFGDTVIQSRPITTDLAQVRAELVYAANNDGLPPFYGDGGGDTPENGVDAMAEGILLLSQFSGIPGGTRALFFKTDTLGYKHQVSSPATVNAQLNTLGAVWLEFGEIFDGTESGFYATTFPETAVVKHDSFPIPV